MHAAWYEKNGAAAEVLAVGEMETPRPGPGEVRVRLATSGVNPSDVKSRAGTARKIAFPRVVPHSDGAGEIDAVGEGVPPSRVGERVWTWNGQWKRPFGTAAEYVVLPSAQAVALPAHIDFAAGACLGIPALTAWHALALAETGERISAPQPSRERRPVRFHEADAQLVLKRVQMAAHRRMLGLSWRRDGCRGAGRPRRRLATI
jgi:NADPH2:quinone reductase